MCLCGYPSHYSFQYFFKTETKEGINEIHLAENYKADMELADSVFRRLTTENIENPFAYSSDFKTLKHQQRIDMP